MPNTLEIDKDIYNALVESFGEDMLKDKIGDILLSAIESRVEQYTREILKFEEKHGGFRSKNLSKCGMKAGLKKNITMK